MGPSCPGPLGPAQAGGFAPPAPGTTRVLAAAGFDGDGRADLVVRTYRGGTKDTVAVYRGSKRGLLETKPAATFSTSAFLAP